MIFARAAKSIRPIIRLRPLSTLEKITPIVDSIAQLNLLETAGLVSALKTKLNIQDIAIAAPQQQTAQAAAPAQEEAKKEQTSFKVTLAKFDAASKAKVIKEIKQMLPGANLVEVLLFNEGKEVCGSSAKGYQGRSHKGRS